MIIFHKIFSGTNTFFVLHSSPPPPPNPPPNPLMVSNGPLPLCREQGKGIPLQYYRSRVLNDPCNWDVFGVRGSGLGIMKTQGRIVLGLLLQEPFVKRFVYQPNKRIYECFCFCFFFFLRRWRGSLDPGLLRRWTTCHGLNPDLAPNFFRFCIVL